MYREYLRKIVQEEKGDHYRYKQDSNLSTEKDEKKNETKFSEITIPVSRDQINGLIVERGNKLNEKVDFDVKISLTMRGIRQQDKEIGLLRVPVYNGVLTNQYESTTKVVRIFTSSTFTDTKYERNLWMEKAYPRIKRFCQARGYEFQVVDMRWGVRDEATDDHKGTELCLKELYNCQKMSTGPNFISLLSHKYGYTALPRTIAAQEFETILRGTNDANEKQLLTKWYKRDDNAVPPLYILQSISKLLPDYLSDDDSEKKEAKSTWWNESEAMRNTLVTVSQTVLDKKESLKYIISITHLEVMKGILECSDPSSHCLWFRRIIQDIENKEPNWELSRYIECLGAEEKWKTSRKLLSELTNQMAGALPKENIHNYSISWAEKGVNPNSPEHVQYLDKMNDDFETHMCNSIDSAIKKRKLISDEYGLYDECLHHIQFCQEKATGIGRNDILKTIQNYVLSDNRLPLVIHGSSGSGKTTVTAMAASKIKSWFEKDTGVLIRIFAIHRARQERKKTIHYQSGWNHLDLLSNVEYLSYNTRYGQTYLNDNNVVSNMSSLHDNYLVVSVDKASKKIAFVCKIYYINCLLDEVGLKNNQGSLIYTLTPLGTTSDSTDLIPFLKSVTRQVKEINDTHSFAPDDLQNLVTEFRRSIEDFKPGKMLVIIFDSLDQFSQKDNARELSWLPHQLPQNVKLIVSTIENPVYKCFPRLQRKIPSTSNFIQVPPFSKEEVNEIVNTWLKDSSRTLTEDQYSILTSSFSNCPLPLYLKLAFDEAVQWTSFMPTDSLRLETTIKASINALFQRLEVMHGKVLTSHALAYLTIAKLGLSEAEMEDILSCDDDVLNDVYMYWTPPIRRLPPLLLVRLRTDLTEKKYLVEKGADGVQVLYWYHRQFSETAKERYCSQNTKDLHKALADFFSGTWANGTCKPFVDSKGNCGKEDRQVSDQPIKFEERYNIRKLNNQSYHRILARDVGLAKSECLFNFEFLLNKIKGTTMRQVFEDYDLATDIYPDDKPLSNLRGALRLSEGALAYSSDLLVSQMIGRLSETEGMEDFLQQCMNSGITYLQPNRDVLIKAGGQLQYAIHAHEFPIKCMDMSNDGTVVATSAADLKIKLWDVIKGNLLRNIESIKLPVEAIRFVLNDACLLIRVARIIAALTFDGDLIWKVDVSPLSHFCIGGVNKSMICIYKEKTMTMYNMSNGTTVTTLTHHQNIYFTELEDGSGSKVSRPSSINYGRDKYMALVDVGTKQFTVIDLDNNSVTDFCRVYDDVEDGSNEREYDIEAIALTWDNEYIIASNFSNNNLSFYERRTLQLTRTIKGVQSDSCQNFQVCSDGKHMLFPSNEWVVIWNLETEERRTVITHAQCVNDVKTRDLKRFVTIAEDQNLRIWNVENSKPANKPGFIGTYVSYLECIPSSHYVVTLSEHRKTYYIQVHDVAKKLKVRQSRLHFQYKDTKFQRPKILGLIGETSILVFTTTKKLKVFDLETLQVNVVLQGFTTGVTVVTKLSGMPEIITTTRGGRNIKFQCSSTGTTKDILKSPDDIKPTISEIHIGSRGGLLVVVYDDECPKIVLVDVQSRSVQHILDCDQNIGLHIDYCIDVQIGMDDSYIVFTELKVPNGYNMPGKKEHIPIVYHISLGKTVELYDRYTDVENYIFKGKSELSVYDSFFLDESRMMISHKDGLIRVWNVHTGEVLHRLTGHTKQSELHSSQDSPYFLSYAVMNEEEAFRLWDKQTLECISTFKNDENQEKVKFLTGDLGFVTSETKPARLIHWIPKGIPGKTKTSNLVFQGQVLNKETHMVCDEDLMEDPNDPDPDINTDEAISKDDV